MRDYLEVWRSGVDVLLAPVTLTDAPTYKSFTQKDNRSQTSQLDYCTQPANMAGKNTRKLNHSSSCKKIHKLLCF